MEKRKRELSNIYQPHVVQFLNKHNLADDPDKVDTVVNTMCTSLRDKIKYLADQDSFSGYRKDGSMIEYHADEISKLEKEKTNIEDIYESYTYTRNFEHIDTTIQCTKFIGFGALNLDSDGALLHSRQKIFKFLATCKDNEIRLAFIGQILHVIAQKMEKHKNEPNANKSLMTQLERVQLDINEFVVNLRHELQRNPKKFEMNRKKFIGYGYINFDAWNPYLKQRVMQYLKTGKKETVAQFREQVLYVLQLQCKQLKNEAWNVSRLTWLQEIEKEIRQFEDKQELTGQDLLQAMYKAHEKESQRRKQNRIKVKLKVGSAVDVYSASRKKWTPGVVNEIQGDALCLLYANGKKKKWVKKDSSTFRPKM